MCGILGIASSESLEINHEFRSALREINHRGPDFNAIWLSENKNLIFGHNRLSILDLSDKGNQPMHFKNRYSIVFNGEIYNFNELKNELKNHNYIFRSNSDTEIILAAYDLWGQDCQKKFIGMFAFSIFDSKKNILFLCRDRSGEKPLYYYFNKKRLYFSSELKSLFLFKEIKKNLNTPLLDRVLTSGISSNEETFIQNIKKLPAGFSLIFDLNIFSIKISKYWDIKPDLKKLSLKTKKNNQIDKFSSIFQKAVERQLISDVPIGVLLSGGIDSSLVTAFASNVYSNINTFNVSFPNNISYDESKYAKTISSFFNTNHHELVIDRIEPDILEKISSIYDEPIFDSSAIPTYLIFNEAKKFSKVVLGGDGGDELFGGYGHYNKILLLKNYKKYFPFLPHNKVAKILSDLLPLGAKGRHWSKLLNMDLKDNLPIIPIFFDKSEKNKLINKKNLDMKIMFDNVFENENTEDLIFSNTLHNFKNYLCENLLVKIDRASMANSIEVRSPFLDKDLIEFAFYELNSNNKVNNFKKKIFLKKIASQVLPNNYNLNRKQGFVIPLNEWLQKGKWRDYFYDILILSDNFFNKKYIQTLFDLQEKGYKNAERLFGLIMISLWIKKNNISY
jgi:asparagine synthase (glutamine-hydrolysing)